METPPRLEMAQGYAIYRPQGDARFRAAVEGASLVVVWCRTHGVARLLIDSRELTGFASPGPEERFLMGEELARAAQAAVKIAFLARTEFMDPERFAVTVARNRGLLSAGFDSEAEAVAWLLDPNAA